MHLKEGWRVDFIFVEGLQVQAHVGIYAREQAAAQAVEINLSFGVSDMSSMQDNIANTIDYDLVVQRIRAVLAAQHFNLLETLGEYLVGVMFDEFGAPWVRISIVKQGVMRGVRRVGVYLERARDGQALPAHAAAMFAP